MDVICAGYDAKSGNICTRMATELLTAGCVHEHIGDRPVCGWHANDADNGHMMCGDCMNAGEDMCVLYIMARESCM